ncbi:glycosyltransferase family 4 protein [Pseudonocardia asaccharolytica]|uniref:Glycosyl transferase n=1 Tax=Pseudonocardia asaccharolytica DSM 44247 = NBRC 16224 TaxID=1123024 RepID=A0A511CWF7_9PSEU|nr:glycosyltransferase family 4 protein [Pseudonocardia asaccharolytica]GEL16906.1 glycosyl transferase [Pseudonocardia asaccharolytica DSM 44247 = NBRC 16224]
MSAGSGTAATRRVLLVSHYFPPHVGGVERVVQGEAVQLAGHGHEVTVLTTAAGSRPGVERVADGYSVVRLRSWNGIERRSGIPFPLVAPWTVLAVARLVRGVDVVHCHDVLYLTTWFAAIAARLLGKPLVLTQHVQRIAHPRRIVGLVQQLVHRTIGGFVIRSAARIAVINGRAFDFLRAMDIPAETVVLLPNGTDTGRFHPAAGDKRPLRRRLGLPEDDVLALFVGRFVPKKGYDKLLQAAGDGYLLVLAGGPPPAAAGEVTGAVFVGSKTPDELADLYRACDLFILPSECEGFPLSVQEAMACGLPVITSDDPGYDVYGLDREWVELIRPTVPEIRAALRRLADDEVRRARMSRYSAGLAVSNFSWSAHRRRLETVYAEALRTHRGNVREAA